MKYINKIINGKSEEILDKLPPDFINLIITSPPYNVDLGNNKFKKDGYDSYKDNKSYKDYINDMKIVFGKCRRILKNDGRIVINIGDTQNAKIPLHSDVIQFMLNDLNYKMYTIILWNKNQIGNRISWGSYCSPSSPSFPRGFEYILVFAKNNLKLEHKGITDLQKKEFIEWSYGIWSFNAETKMMKEYNHPAMFPEELPKRCIKMFTYQNDVILDPYCGAGTTCYVAKLLKRNYIGIDISKEYCKTAIKRCNKITNEKIWNLFF